MRPTGNWGQEAYILGMGAAPEGEGRKAKVRRSNKRPSGGVAVAFPRVPPRCIASGVRLQFGGVCPELFLALVRPYVARLKVHAASSSPRSSSGGVPSFHGSGTS
jgi:hypothetical protein